MSCPDEELGSAGRRGGGFCDNFRPLPTGPRRTQRAEFESIQSVSSIVCIRYPRPRELNLNDYNQYHV